MYPARYREIASSPSGRSEVLPYIMPDVQTAFYNYTRTFLVCYTLYDRNSIFKNNPLRAR
jgi:hypothetical protein